MMELIRTGDNDRIVWIDIFKGILIILMVMGHSGAPFTTYIYLFHMPAFFFLSGYTYHGDRYNVFSYTKKKVLNLLVPAFLINILFIIFYCILQRMGFYSILQNGPEISFFTRIKLLFLNLSMPDFGGATWFIFVLFLVEVIFLLLTKFCIRIGFLELDVFFALLLGCYGWYLAAQSKRLIWELDLVLIGCLFFALGILAGRYNVLIKYINHKLMLPFSMMITIFFGSYYFNGQLPMNWPTRQFASFPIQFLSFACAFYLCWRLALVLEETNLYKLLIFIGRHTYCILIMHFVMFRICFVIMVMLNLEPVSYLKNLTPAYSPYPLWILMTVLSIGGCCVLALFAEKNKISNYLFNAQFTSNWGRIG